MRSLLRRKVAPPVPKRMLGVGCGDCLAYAKPGQKFCRRCGQLLEVPSANGSGFFAIERPANQ
jgi:hypothetical protein